MRSRFSIPQKEKKDSLAAASPEPKAQDRPEFINSRSPSSSRWPASSPDSYCSSDEDPNVIDEDEVDLDFFESFAKQMAETHCDAEGADP